MNRVDEQPRPQRLCAACKNVGHTCITCPYKEIRCEFIKNALMYITNTIGLQSLPYLIRSLLNEALNSLFTGLRPFMSNLSVDIIQHEESTKRGKELRIIHFITEHFHTTLRQYGTRDGMYMMNINPLYRERAYVNQRIFTVNASARLNRHPELRRYYINIVHYSLYHAPVAVVEVLRINRRLVNEFDVEPIDIDTHSPLAPPPPLSSEVVFYTVDPRPSAPTTTGVAEFNAAVAHLARAEARIEATLVRVRPQSKMSISVSQFKSSEGDCPICLEVMGDKVVMTDCNHCVCSGCMVSSLKSYTVGAKCCMCRQVVSNCTFANKTALNEFKTSLSQVK